MARLVFGTDKTASVPAKVVEVGPAYYIEKTDNGHGLLQQGSSIINLSGITSIGWYALAYAYCSNSNITGAVDLSNITTVQSNGLAHAFENCDGITSIDLSGLVNTNGRSCDSICYHCTSLTSADLSGLITIKSTFDFSNAFQDCTALTSFDLSNLEYNSGGNSSMAGMFQGCTGLTTANLPSLVAIYASSGSNSNQITFKGCTGLTSANLGSLVYIGGVGNACTQMFNGDTNLATVDISKLAKISGNYALNYTFYNCTSLTSLSFNNLAYTNTNFNGVFANTLSGVTGCTVHFPAEWQTTMANWSNIINGMGGTNTTVLFDLPNVRKLDLTSIKVIRNNVFKEFANNNYFPNIISVDLSGLKTIRADSACTKMFYNCSNITSVDLSNLEEFASGWGYECFADAFYGTGITSMTFNSLSSMKFGQVLRRAFAGCTALTSLSFPALTSTSFGTYTNQFNNMLSGVSGCTVHFPSNLQSVIGSWSDVTAGFGGTNTTVLFDLTATE